MRKFLYEDIKKYFEREGWSLLSTEYKNNYSKLNVLCPNNHNINISFKNFKKGYRCSICSKKAKHDYEYVKKSFNKDGYNLLSTEYKNNKQLLEVKCPHGNLWRITFNKFKNFGIKCNCNKDVHNKLTYDYVSEFYKNIGYNLLSTEYNNAHEKLDIECSKGHFYKGRFNDFQQGVRCPICNAESTSSKQEKELQDFIESLGYDIVRNDRTQIINPLTNRYLELDVWIPDLNKALEYNGIYWHGKNNIIKKDRIKADQCKQKGIDLLIVNEDKWINNREMEQDIIIKFLDKRFVYETNYM